MSLWLRLHANNDSLGMLVIRCTNAERGISYQDATYRYEVDLDGRVLGYVDHRYGDGAWALVHKAVTLVTYHPSTIPPPV